MGRSASRKPGPRQAGSVRERVPGLGSWRVVRAVAQPDTGVVVYNEDERVCSPPSASFRKSAQLAHSVSKMSVLPSSMNGSPASASVAFAS
jgi:hypothetical protein